MVNCTAKVNKNILQLAHIKLKTGIVTAKLAQFAFKYLSINRYGPPPSYPNLKIPGLNAPIPEGTSFGYHAGGWGKPPVDEKGKPLYGDVFGTSSLDADVST